MTPEMQRELLNQLDAVAAKLGTTANQLWALMLRQARIEAIESTIFALVCGGVALWLLVNTRRMVTWISEDRFGVTELVWIPYAIVLLASTIFAVASFQNALTCWLNPAYYAFHEILQIVK